MRRKKTIILHLQPWVLGVWGRKQPPFKKHPGKEVYSEEAGFNHSKSLKGISGLLKIFEFCD